MVIESEVDNAWQCAKEQFGGSYFRVASGEYNHALLVDSNPEQTEAAYVIKIPRSDTPKARQQLVYETNVIQHFKSEAENAPIEIPQFLGKNSKPDEPMWAALSFVPGNVLSYGEIISRFTELDLIRLGQTIGETIAWFSEVMDINSYKKLGNPGPIDRELRFLDANESAISMDDQFPLFSIFSQLFKDDYEWLKMMGLLRPTIIGHDDIGPGNLAFSKLGKRWHLTGLFDFGMTAPSSPEREARHAMSLGRHVGRAALESYYGVHDPLINLTKTQFDNIHAEDVSLWWAEAQAVITGIWRMRFGRPLGSVPLRLGAMYHTFDWSADLDSYQARSTELLQSSSA